MRILKQNSSGNRSMWVAGASVSAISGTRRLNKNSSTGHTGVSVDVKSGKYRAYINFRRKQYHPGLYDKIEDAVEARKTAEKNIYGDFLDWYAKEYPEDCKRMEKKGMRAEYRKKAGQTSQAHRKGGEAKSSFL